MTTLRYLIVVLVTLVLVLPSMPQRGAAQSSSWVEREGGQLVLEGKPFPVVGANAHWLGLYKGANAYPTRAEIDDVMATARRMGATVIRSHTLGISTGCPKCIKPKRGVWNDKGFTAIDYAIASARKHQLRLIVPLTDNWHYYHGGKHDFTDWRKVPEDAFFTNSTVIGDFKKYITHVLRHVNPHTGLALKDDPTIMAWETGNELNPSDYKWTSAHVDWTRQIANHIKWLSPNALVMDGHHASPRTTSLLDAALSVWPVDLYSAHLYPLNVEFTNRCAAQAAAKDKVFLIGEYDWTEANGGDSLAAFFAAVEDPANAIAGDLFWTSYGSGSVLGGGTIASPTPARRTGSGRQWSP